MLENQDAIFKFKHLNIGIFLREFYIVFEITQMHLELKKVRHLISYFKYLVLLKSHLELIGFFCSHD